MKTTPRLFLLSSFLFLVGCSTATVVTPPPTLTRPVVIALSPTPTATPFPEPTSTPTTLPTITPTPGPDLRFMYFVDDAFYEYDLSSWTAHKVDIASVGLIRDAQLSPDQAWFAYLDDEGLKLINLNQQSIQLIKALDSETTGLSFILGQKYLSYTDSIGLQIYALSDGSNFTLIENEYTIDPTDTTRYFPDQWSPDGQWLWVDVSYYEDQSRLLFHIPTKKEFEFTSCNWYIDWHQDSSFMLTSVTYSGYSGCGCEDGIFRVDLRNDHSIIERRIFQVTSGCELEARATNDLRLSPDGQQIVFVQVEDPDWESELDHLMLMNTDGSNLHELVTSKYWIDLPIWLSDGRFILYLVHDNLVNRVMRYSFEDGKSIELFSTSSYIDLSDPIESSDWMMIHVDPLDDSAAEQLYLVNIQSAQSVRLDNMDSLWIEPVRSDNY